MGFEFIELQNIGVTQIDLTGIRLAGAVDFTFPSMTLEAGAYVVVVADVAQFSTRYETGLNVAGPYSGDFNDDGETVQVLHPLPASAVIQEFTYDDAWQPSTDGPGNSLVILDPTDNLADWSVAGGWRASHDVNGSPGTDDFLRGDLNQDNVVGVADLAVLQSRFGGVTTAGPTVGDLDRDGNIDRRDVAMFVRNLGRSYTLPVPSPSPIISEVTAIDSTTDEETSTVVSIRIQPQVRTAESSRVDRQYALRRHAAAIDAAHSGDTDQATHEYRATRQPSTRARRQMSRHHRVNLDAAITSLMDDV